MAAVMDAEQRRKLEDALLRKAEALVRQLRQAAESGNPANVDAQAAIMTELLKAREFPTQRAAEFRETTKTIQRSAYQLSVDTLIGQAERRGHAGDDKGRNELITRAKEHYAKAVRFGADEEFRSAVERRVQAALMTSKDGIDDRTKQAAARKLEQHDVGAKAPGGIERRRCIRYMDPVMTVELGGRKYQTVNWSIRGLLLENYRGELELSPGDRVKLDVHCTDVPEVGTVSGRQVAHVVRVDAERNTLALDFPEMSTVILDLVHRMKDAGIRPEPER